MNPQKEIPVLDDNGFYLGESIAIMQYLCDKYHPESTLYPKEPTQRAIVNHRLLFNMGFYYNNISQYVVCNRIYKKYIYDKKPLKIIPFRWHQYFLTILVHQWV